jgi:ligand-binding SRPBCC domain-containing protein
LTRDYVLTREQFIPRSLDDVFAFFSDARNLEEITPGFLKFRIATPQPIAMGAGTLIDYRLRLFAAPISWRTLIESFDPPHAFVDVQLRGPYRRWRHEHRFEPAAGGVRMIDRVDYQLPLAPLDRLAHAWFVKRTLERIFDYRRDRVQQLLAAPQASLDCRTGPCLTA